MQFTMPIVRTWDSEKILKNFEILRSEIEWKDFDMIFDELLFARQGYFVFKFIRNDGKGKSAIHISRNSVQITSNNAIDYEICFIFLSMLLRENEKDTLIETLNNKFEEDRELPKEFQKAIIEMITSLYFDLVEGNIQDELVEMTKNQVTAGLLIMLEELDKIGNGRKHNK